MENKSIGFSFVMIGLAMYILIDESLESARWQEKYRQ